MGMIDKIIKREKVDETATENLEPQNVVEQENKTEQPNRAVPFQILKKQTQTMFPTDGKWSAVAFKHVRFKQEKGISDEYAPFHLDDQDWLIQFLERKMAKNSIAIPRPLIKEYFDYAVSFKDVKHDYALEIVKWQINSIMRGGKNWMMPDGFVDLPPIKSNMHMSAEDKDKMTSALDVLELSNLNAPDLDKLVRGAVVKSLSTIGLDGEVIEEGLEKFASHWRKACMLNGYYDLFHGGETTEAGRTVNKDHQALWLANREYDYYQEHKTSVDRYGIPTDAMKMTPAEHYKLLKVLNRRDNEQMAAYVAENNMIHTWDDIENNYKKLSQQIAVMTTAVREQSITPTTENGLTM